MIILSISGILLFEILVIFTIISTQIYLSIKILDSIKLLQGIFRPDNKSTPATNYDHIDTTELKEDKHSKIEVYRKYYNQYSKSGDADSFSDFENEVLSIEKPNKASKVIISEVDNDEDYSASVSLLVENVTQDDQPPNLIALNKNEVTIRIQNAINSYLNNNFGAAVNFSIVKDIIDREVEAIDETINQQIATPLYLGIAAAMFGIILGIMAMPSFVPATFYDRISTILKGVMVALSASLVGLISTTYLTAFHYKSAKADVLKSKNDQLSYLQAKLLPLLVKADETGLSGLNNNLREFARSSKGIIKEIGDLTLQTSQNLKFQNEIIRRVDSMDLKKVSNANIEIFKRFEKNLSALESFSTYLESLSGISQNLKSFADNTSSIEHIASRIDSNLEDSRLLMQFLSSHLKKIEEYGVIVGSAINETDINFRDSLDSLKIQIDVGVDSLKSTANNHEISLRDIYHNIIQTLEVVTSEHVEKLKMTYENAVPNFNKLELLEKLHQLEKINHAIKDHEQATIHEMASNNQNIGNKINALEQALEVFKKSFEELNVTGKLNKFDKKLNSIEDKISKKKIGTIWSWFKKKV